MIRYFCLGIFVRRPNIKAREKLFQRNLATPTVMPKKDGRIITYLKGKVWKESLLTFGDISSKIVPIRVLRCKGKPSESIIPVFDGNYLSPKIALFIHFYLCFC